MRVFENGVLMRIFEPKRNDVKGEWRRLHNEERHALYSSPNIIRMIEKRRLKWAGLVARIAEMIDAFRLLVGKPEGRRTLEIPRIDKSIILK